VISNIAIEPEIMELISMLRSMGAVIFLSSGREITVQGVEKLFGTEMHILGDRLEAASWASLACASNGEVFVQGIRPETLGNFLSHYTQVGGGYRFEKADGIRFYRKRPLTPTVIETDVFPGFSTDWQQPFAILLTQAKGVSVIHETVYEQRFGYLPILNILGAQTQLTHRCLGSQPCRYQGFDFPHSALIIGPTPLRASEKILTVPDIRAGLAYVIAGAIAEGTTVLDGIEEIERGYGDLPKRLSSIGLQIEKILIS
jgi:UDP-N-acetylglucosamine 1-carboxyvinyltransferase